MKARDGSTPLNATLKGFDVVLRICEFSYLILFGHDLILSPFICFVNLGHLFFNFIILILDTVDYFIEFELTMQVDGLNSSIVIVRCKNDGRSCHQGRTITDVGIKVESEGKKAKEEERVVVVKSL